MEEFEKKLKKAQKGTKKAGIIFLIIAIVLVAVGVLQSSTDKESWATFDGLDSGEYYKAEILYLIGPFAEYGDGDKVEEELYTACTKDNEYILISAKPNIELPILGDNVTEENLETIEPVTIYGYAKMLEDGVEEYLVDFWNEVYGYDIFTTENYKQIFGYSYLDTTNAEDDTSTVCYIFAATFGFIAIVSLLGGKKKKQKTSEMLNKLGEDGILEVIKNEYADGIVDKYKKINLDVTKNYIVSYSPQLVIVPVVDVVNAYRTNMINGVYQPCRYIALETKENKKYFVAAEQLDSKNLEFEKALEQIKSKVMQGGN